MNRRTHALSALALAFLVALAGCSAFVADQEEKEVPDADEIQADAVAQLSSVESYNYSMTTTIEFGGNNLTSTAVGTVNRTAQRMSADPMTTTVRTNSTTSKKVSRAYVIGDQQCIHVNSTWEQKSTDRSPWRGGANLSTQQELLNSSTATVTNGTLDGQAVYVIEVKPDNEAIRKLVGEQESGDEVEFRNVTYRQFVDKDSKNLLKSAMSATYVVSGREATMKVEMSFSDYNTSHPVTLPKEAVKDGKKAGPCAGMASGSTGGDGGNDGSGSSSSVQSGWLFDWF
ncbi:hypothetical protein [Haloarchaeobius sp. TZWWS8]|uniref:hypothetical protein n=1 Tax=Haloarchaeobius sp. TZWWS8 TaxID=3446121 RepID=UPI003EBB8D0E